MTNFLAIGLLALGVFTASLAATAPAAAAPPVAASAAHPYAPSRPVPGRYIVVFWDSVAHPAAEAANLLRPHGGQLHHTYTRAIKGFAATLPDAALQAIRNNPNVAYVEQDQTVSLNETKLNPQGEQSGATWGLDRIDQTALPLNKTYLYNYTGAGVHAFIIDTGIRATHGDLAGRVNVADGYSAISGGTDDCNGHGTHVAGTVGGATWGVAKAVSLIPVRVLNCQGSGTWSGVIAGIDWTANSARRPAVANMSLGGGASQAVDDAVAGAVSKGVTVVVAAGNSTADACKSSPARAPSALTVGATTRSDARASYSNYGKCLDLFAPGSEITSAWHTSDSATDTISGTSMASPHVAGVAALALAANPAASPWAVTAFLTNNAGSFGLQTTDGSPNRLVYSLAGGAPQEPVGTTVAVQSLTGSAVSIKNGWRASAVVTIAAHDGTSFGTPVAGATVLATFSPGGTARCVTDAYGSCTLTSTTINKNTGQTQLTVTSASGVLMNYDAGLNTASQITISKTQ